MTVEEIMGAVEDRIIDLRGCSRQTARSYMAGYLRNKEQSRIADAERALNEIPDFYRTYPRESIATDTNESY